MVTKEWREIKQRKTLIEEIQTEENIMVTVIQQGTTSLRNRTTEGGPKGSLEVCEVMVKGW